MLTIPMVAGDPSMLRTEVTTPSGEMFLLRPLMPDDVVLLSDFLTSLGPTTREMWMSDGYTPESAGELCAATGRFDKLRMVPTRRQQGMEQIVGLFEFSFGIPEGDAVRFRGYGIALEEGFDCRFAPCLRDELQSKGVATAIVPSLLKVARRFGCGRIILWGGVLTRNEQAIRFYERHGFVGLGRFVRDGRESLDMVLELR